MNAAEGAVCMGGRRGGEFVQLVELIGYLEGLLRCGCFNEQLTAWLVDTLAEVQDR